MGWPYAFIDLSDEEKAIRRQSLDFYAAVAHYSALIPILAVLLSHLIQRAVQSRRKGANGADYQQLPHSPVVKAARLSGRDGIGAVWRRLQWWMGDDVYFAGGHWGQKDQWVIGSIWMVWLLVLCVLGTGRDYMHFTKRFGTIAVSQLPLQYLLSLKAVNPLAYLLTTSHETINRYHRVLGRLIYALTILHAIFYHIFFFAKGVWLKRFFAPMVFCGVVAWLCFHLLTGTAIVRIRAYSYRLFFITHLIAALAVPPLLFFHAPSIRIYLVEAIGIFLVDLVVRKVTTATAATTIESIPGTNLLKISASLPSSKISKYEGQPGSHVYLSVPAEARTTTNPASSSPLFDFLFNPFTVSSISSSSNTITLIARQRNGPLTKHLAHFASLPASSSSAAQVPLGIEGPYGTAGKNFSSLLSCGAERFLLFAGGVGATFVLPIYHAITAENPSAKVQLVWALRSAGDATWATSSPSGQSVLDDPHVQLFLTGDMGLSSPSDDTVDSSIEMAPLSSSTRRNAASRRSSARRPDVQKIVDDTFRQGGEEAVAVLVCGPAEMAREVRMRVRPWAMRGRKVWWHDESFGW